MSFIDYDETVLDVQSVRHGRDAVLPLTPTRTGHLFAGWDADHTNITRDTTIQATYAVMELTVMFYDQGMNLLKEETVSYGQAATPPHVPEVEFQVFIGWDGDVTEILGDAVFTAQYVPAGQDAFHTCFYTHLAATTWSDEGGLVERSEGGPFEEVDDDLYLHFFPHPDGSTELKLRFAEGSPFLHELCGEWEMDTGTPCPFHFDDDLVEILRSMEPAQQYTDTWYQNGIHTGMAWEKGCSIGIGCHDGYLTITMTCWEKVWEGDALFIDTTVQFLIQFPLDGSHPPRWGVYDRDGRAEKWTQNWHYTDDEWSDHFPE